MKTNYDRKLAALKSELGKAGGNTSQLDINVSFDLVVSIVSFTVMIN